MKKRTISTIMKMFLFNFTTVLTILVIHEFGHFLIGEHMGCDGGKIILMDTSTGGPYTELSCSDEVNHKIGYFGSLGMTLFFSSLFLFLGDIPERNLFFVTIGFSLIFWKFDLLMISNNPILEHSFILTGTILIILGEFLIGVVYAKNQTPET